MAENYGARVIVFEWTNPKDWPFILLLIEKDIKAMVTN